MKIGIVSDTHGCLETWRQIFARYFFDAGLILHAGDILYHGARNPIPAEYNPKELVTELNNCPVPIVAVCGNCDSEVDATVLEFPVQAPYTYLLLDGLRIVVTHGQNLETKTALAQKLKADLFITGHTHAAELQETENRVFLNPGSPGMTKRLDGRGTIALLENGSVAIIDVATGEKLASQKVGK